MSLVDEINPPPPLLLRRSPVAWLAVFGPGAIMASLTIGTGELVFSSRGGALFGFGILPVFVGVLLLKWVLVFVAARHMVLTGAHPFERYRELPGPRGWMLVIFLLVAALCIPVWVGFHSTVIGNLIASLTGALGEPGSTADALWGACVLASALLLAVLGGYSTLERVQIGIVTLMLAAVGVSLFLYHPPWLEMLEGLIVPRQLQYPSWVATRYPEVTADPIWVEVSRYVGVMGGAGFDYLAYVSFLRDKGWGCAGQGLASPRLLEAASKDPRHPVRAWLRAPLVDCILSFVVVLAFSSVFVACGAIVLAPHQELPTEANLLTLQSRFLTNIHPWLFPLYIMGAFLAMTGTLYGTIEVAQTMARELLLAMAPALVVRLAGRVRRLAIGLCALGAAAVLSAVFVARRGGSAESASILTTIWTPANLFTSVLSCGLICLLNPWMDRRFLPRSLRAPAWSVALSYVASAVFLAVGARSYWMVYGGRSIAILGAFPAVGLVTAAIFARRPKAR